MKFRAYSIIGLLLLTVEINSLSSPEVCTTQACLNAALKIHQYINPNIDPCVNFYEFACGNFLENAHGDEELQFGNQLKKRAELERIELYREEIKQNDNKLVKIAKRLYNGCLEAFQIEDDSIQILQRVFKQVGGWPVLEGSKWNEEDFDWVKATYKLRELGYHSDIFIKLQTTYIDKKSHRLLEILDGDYMLERVEVMSEMAMKFNLENKEDIIKELRGAYDLSAAISEISMNTDSDMEILTIKELQEKIPSVNWLEYINNIVSPVVQLTKDNKVSFFTEYLQSLINLLARTPKRDVANLMMWKLMRSVIPFFDDDFVNPYFKRNVCQNRAQFCVETIEEKFYPSPIEVIYDRKYLSTEKKKKIEEMATNIKTVAIEIVSNAEWLPETGKNEILEKLNKLKFQIGLPGDYFDDKIFNYADTHMVDNENGTFLDLLARANRNLKAAQFRLITKATDDLYTLYCTLPWNEGYYKTNELIYVPAYMTRDMVYNENIPEYINYGIMGTILGDYVTDIICIECLDKYSEKTAELLNNKRECVKQSWHGLDVDESDVNKVLRTNIAQQLAYKAYKQYVKEKGEERKLMTVDYTPNQLFWIFTAARKCRPVGPTDQWLVAFEKHVSKTTVYEVNNPLGWNHKFTKDFKCSEGSKINHAEKCNVF